MSSLSPTGGAPAPVPFALVGIFGGGQRFVARDLESHRTGRAVAGMAEREDDEDNGNGANGAGPTEDSDE